MTSIKIKPLTKSLSAIALLIFFSTNLSYGLDFGNIKKKIPSKMNSKNIEKSKKMAEDACSKMYGPDSKDFKSCAEKTIKKYKK